MPISLVHESSAFNDVGSCSSSGGSTTSTSFFTDVAGAAWSPTLGLFAVVGDNCLSAVSVATSPGNGTWTSRGNPWGTGAATGHGNGVVWAPALSKFVAVGYHSTGASSATSPDGVTWTKRPDVAGEVFLFDVFWSETLGQFLATGATNRLYRSTDGISWTVVAGFPTTILPQSFVYRVGIGWVGVGFGGSGSVVTAATSPDGITWTGRHTAFDSVGALTDVIWSTTLGEFVACGRTSSGTRYGGATSPTGVTWTPFAAPWSGAFPAAILDLGGYLAVSCPSVGHALTFTRDLSTFETEVTPFDSGSEMTGRNMAYASSLNKLVVTATAVPATGTNSGLFGGAPVAPVVPRSTRFFEGYPWRFIFTDIKADAATPRTFGGVTTTWAQGILTNRGISKTLNQSTTIQGAVWPDDERANEIAYDGFPVIAQNNRLVYCFRREGGSPPWKIRAAGLLMSPEDQGDPDIPLTHFVAYDPWTSLAGRLAVDTFGDPATSAYGFSYTGNTGDNIATQLLKNTILTHGPVFIDAGVSWGGTAFWAGTIETTSTLVFNVQQGATVADIWTELVNTGTMDIVLTPVYDPRNRPGITHDLSIFKLAGDDLPAVVFGWDKMNRALTSADRMHSGTPGDFVNKVYYYPGQGGLPAVPQPNDVSIATYGEVQTSQFFPIATMPSGQTPTLLAQQALQMGKQGKRTFTVSPTPERSPIPLRDYDVGDRVGIYTTKRLRVATTASFAIFPPAAQRVQTIPIVIDDDGIERIQAMVTSPDWRDPEEPPVAPIRTAAGRAGTSAAVLAAGIRSVRRRGIYRTTAGTRLQTFYGHSSGYGYGT